MTTLGARLDRLFEDGIKASLMKRGLAEREKQQAGSRSPTTDDADDGMNKFFGGGEADEDGAASKTMDDESEKLQKGDIDPGDIVEKLNSIRSGRSFKDSSIAKSIDEYVTSLSRSERVALMAFLKGIAQIVTGEIPAKAAEDPGKHPADIHMNKSNEPEKHVVHKRPHVAASQPSSAKAVHRDEEDTTPPAPIVAKRRGG